MKNNSTKNGHSIANTIPIGCNNINDDEALTIETIAENQYSEQHFAEGLRNEESELNISLQ
jgi:hypothetical protein